MNGKGKKPVRRNPEARRQQNRIASRNYREKRKQKLALLDQILDPKTPEPSQAVIATQESSQSASETAPGLNNVNDGRTDEAVMGTGWGGIPTTNVDFMMFQDPLLTAGPSTDYPSGMDALSAWGSLDFGLTRPTFNPTTTAPVSQDLITLPPSQPLQTLPQPSPSNSQARSFLSVLEGIETLTTAEKRALIRHLQHQTLADTSPPTRLQLEAQRFAQALHDSATGLPTAPNSCLTSGGFFGALFANCFALGMPSVEPLLSEDGWSIFSLAPELGYHPSQLSVVRAKFRGVAPDLSPVDKQLTVAHHPYLDIFPFKTFRENALTALEHDPPLLDEDDLCHDLVSGAIICWGAQQKDVGMEGGVPWDIRSWEPQVWFLKKYRHMVGGWDDDMWKQARRWHNMRGERIQEI